jgi:hypothetical protein
MLMVFACEAARALAADDEIVVGFAGEAPLALRAAAANDPGVRLSVGAGLAVLPGRGTAFLERIRSTPRCVFAEPNHEVSAGRCPTIHR